jgi:hypothetical protein
MKRYDDSRFNHDKHRAKQWHNEHKSDGFKCSHCKQFVVINDHMGTVNRNHCNTCLWSKHVDEAKGDRQATCNDGMKPIGLTFKHEGYGRTDELMLIHLCLVCQKISINRLARDDLEHTILGVFSGSPGLDANLKSRLTRNDIYLLTESDRQELETQLFGVAIA